MVWDRLGKLAPSPEWQRLDISALDDSLLRITHSYNARPIGFAYLSSVFSDGSRGLFRRLYPYKEETRLMEYEAGAEFRQAGFNFRVLEVKASPRLRMYDLSWAGRKQSAAGTTERFATARAQIIAGLKGDGGTYP